MNEWGIEEVCKMFGANNLADVIPALRRDEVTGIKMLNCDAESLKDKGVPDDKIELVLAFIEKLKLNQDISSFSFDSLVLDKKALRKGLLDIYTNLDLQGKLNLTSEQLKTYILEVSKKYHDTAFHNFTHVFDVTQVLYSLVTKSGLTSKLSDAQLCGLFLAAPSHDLDHPGLSNSYQVNAETDLAKKYNNVSVLESHHTALCLGLVDELQLLANVAPEMAEAVKATITTAILGTDMARHKDYMDALGIHTMEEAPVDPQAGELLMVTLMKCSDISNPSRPLVVADKWNALCYEEFYHEGDLEKEAGRKVIPLFDRETNHISKSTVGFVNFVVLPLYKKLDALLKKLAKEHEELKADAVEPVLSQLEKNVEVHKLRSAM